jgi:hypothetical protein
MEDPDVALNKLEIEDKLKMNLVKSKKSIDDTNIS